MLIIKLQKQNYRHVLFLKKKNLTISKGIISFSSLGFTRYAFVGNANTTNGIRQQKDRQVLLNDGTVRFLVIKKKTYGFRSMLH